MGERSRHLVVLVITIIVCLGHCSAINFKNGGFESTDYNGNWQAMGCSLKSSNDARTGSHSVHIFNRHQNWNALTQYITLEGNKVYKVVFYVKLITNVHNKMYEEVEVYLACKDQHGKDFYQSYGRSPHVQHGLWYEVGGVKRIPADSHGCRIYVQAPTPTEYLVDDASITEVTLDSNWKTAANQRIDTLRKADVSIRLAGSQSSSTNVNVELVQLGHEFAFGSAVRAVEITDSSHHAYQQVFYDLFEWAVFVNALKWYATEPHKGVFNYNPPLHAIKVLREHGIKIRGHNVFWEAETYVQGWLKGLSKSQLMSEIDARVQRVIGRTKGLLEHWDVNNEDINNDYYAQKTGNPNITMEMFKKVHAVDSHPKLFLNEYFVLTRCDKAMALMNKAKMYKDAGIPIGAIGAEGHFHEVDLTEIWGRLNILEEAGLPVYVTELGINDRNENTKAQKLEDMMTMFFSHPAVEGVLFWGYWDQIIWEKDAALFTGPNVTPNAAGRKLQDLLKKQWRSHVTGTVQGTQSWNTRVFKGKYRLDVKHNGHVISTENFTLSGSGQTLELHMDGEQNGHPHVSNIVVG